MKKFIKTIIITAIIILILLFIEANLDIIGIFAFSDITDEELLLYDGYYYNQLSELQKKIYIKIHRKSNECKSKVTLGKRDIFTVENDVNKALTAFIYDNPRNFNIENKYTMTHMSFVTATYSILRLEYIYDDINVLKAKENELDLEVKRILTKVINEDMTQYEKELAIHDELVKQANYYNYKKIVDIPSIKHTAYAAIVDKQTVCDGYAKAFKILLDEENIDCIVVSGIANDEPHAWNIVKLEDEYYNVDVTSDVLNAEGNKHIIHRYFNVSNDRIRTTHSFDNLYTYPECKSEEYNFYIFNNYVLAATDIVSSKLQDVISAQKESSVLELMVDKVYPINTLVNALYSINFNNMQTKGETKVEYIKMEDVYVFEK